MQLIGIKQLSEFLNVKEATLYSWANNGSIPAYKINGIWRFDMNEIKVWVKKARRLMDPPHKSEVHNQNNLDIDSVIRNAIDEVKGR